jgi:hypothetical protein
MPERGQEVRRGLQKTMRQSVLAMSGEEMSHMYGHMRAVHWRIMESVSEL